MIKTFPSNNNSTTTTLINNVRDQIFISYSHKDKAFLDELLEHLSPLVRHDVISNPWSDREIEAGERWGKSIDEAIYKAKLVILLVSPSFLASKFVAKNELEPIYAASQHRELRIFAVAVRPSSYTVDQYLSSIQFANDPTQPIAKFTAKGKRDGEWVKNAEKIAKLFNS